MNVSCFRKLTAFILALAVTLPVFPLPLFLAASAAPTPLLTPADTPWPQFGVTPGHSFTYNGTGRGYHDVLVKWRLAASSGGGSSIANFSADIALNNTTSKPDVLSVVVAQPSSVVIAAGNNGSIMWSYPVFGGLFATPIVADLNLDGKPEVVTRDTNGQTLALTPNITWDGSSYSFPFANATQRQAQELWNQSLSGVSSTNNDLSTPIAADILGTASPELLVPAGDRLFLLNGATGAQMSNYTVDGTIVGAPAVYRVSSAWRVAVGSVNTTGVNTSIYTVTLFDGNLNFLTARNFTQSYDPFLLKSPDDQLPSPGAGDLEGAGPADDLAVMTAYEDSLSHLRIYLNGSNTASSDLTLAGMAGASPAVTDIDGDGTDEIVALSYGPGRFATPNSKTFVEVFNGSGTRRWNATVDEIPGAPREHVLASPALADLDGDGVRDIVVFLTDGWSEARSGANGSRIFRHQQLNQGAATEKSSPAIADLDKDGFLDITADGGTVSYSLAELFTTPPDITLVPSAPQEFENVTVSATIHNSGNAPALNVSVEFLEGVAKLNASTIGIILPTGTAQAQTVINFSGGGPRTLTVRVDPNNTVEEIDEANNSVSITVNVTSNYGFHFESPLNRTAVQPGFAYAFIVNTVADGALDNEVNLSYGTLPAGWAASISPSTVNLTGRGTPGDTNTSFFSVTTSTLSVPGEYDLSFSGVSLLNSRNSANFTFTIVISGQYGVAMNPRNVANNVTAGDLVPYSFNVLNSGNSNDTFQFAVGATPPGWSGLSSRSNVSLGPGQTTTVLLQIRAPANATVGENATVSLRATSTGDPTKNDTVFATSTVVVPDLVVTDITFFRECGGESTTGAPHLVMGDTSSLRALVANAAGNAAVTNVGMIVWAEGVPLTGSVSVPATGVGVFQVNYTFTSSGLKSVTAQADPNDQISELSEANNALTEQTTVKDATPVGDLRVQGWILNNGTAVPFASVVVSNLRTGANISTTAASDGHYAVDMLMLTYLDGDGLKVNATDGLDVGSYPLPLCAYSEDAVLEVNVTLGLPSPYDFLLIPVGSTTLDAAPGAAARFQVDVRNRGVVNNTVFVSASGLWAIRILDANSSATSVVALGPNESKRIQVEVTPPGGQDPGVWNITVLNGTAAGRTRLLSLNTTIAVVRQVQLNGPSQAAGLSGTDVFLNLTVANGGNVNETVTMAVQDPQASGASFVFTPAAPTIARAGAAIVEVRITIPTGAASGNFSLNFTATSTANTSVVASLTVALRVTQQRFDFTLTGARSMSVAPGASRTTTLNIVNLGTIPDTYDVAASLAPVGFTVRTRAGAVPAATFTADPGATATVTIEILSPLEVTLEQFELDFVVTSRGLTNSGNTTPDRSFTLTALIGNVYDFKVTGPNFSTPPVVDVETQVYAVVENVGTRSFVGSLVVRFNVSGTTIATKTITSLAAGARTTVGFPWTPRFAGPAALVIEVNPPANSAVYESSFVNNLASANVFVSPPKPSDIFSNPGTYLFIAVILILAIGVAVTVHRREDARKVPDAEQTAEESDARRKGGGSGGLERL